MSDKIKVISAYNGRCGIDSNELRISRRWDKCGAVQTFTKDQIEELMFVPAFRNMVNEGLLYIDNMEVKKELGIEPEDAETPTLRLMDEKEMNRLWKTMPFAQFKLEAKSLTKQQLDNLAEYAIQHGDDGSIEKANYLSSITEYKILKGIELERANQEV